jgi:F-type H+-transporting ATPase subunit epsilon
MSMEEQPRTESSSQRRRWTADDSRLLAHIFGTRRDRFVRSERVVRLRRGLQQNAISMSSTATASAYWRVAGMSYLKYSNLCATMVRDALQAPMKEQAKARELVYFKNITYKDGKPDTQSALRHLALAGCARQTRRHA